MPGPDGALNYAAHVFLFHLEEYKANINLGCSCLLARAVLFVLLLVLLLQSVAVGPGSLASYS